MTVREIFDQSTDAEMVMAETVQFSSEPRKFKEWPTTFPQSVYTKWGKRVFDLSLALLLLPFLIAPILFVALLVKQDGGPGFFLHKRVGKGGKEFGCMKIRTMRVDAEEYLQSYLAENETARKEWNETYKLKNDPRITKLGKFLRKTSLDELPQLFNVLRGEMSFVGPRPVPAKELAEYGSAKLAYQLGRPGITGEWQVSGRNEISYSERIELDVSYRRKETFVKDLFIISKTPLLIIKSSGM